jgi:hypothetical protein
VAFHHCSLSSNTAAGKSGHGGGVYAIGADLQLRATAVRRNEAQADGGGVLLRGVSSLAVRDSSFAGNTARTGGQIFNAGTGSVAVAGTNIAMDNSPTDDVHMPEVGRLSISNFSVSCPVGSQLSSTEDQQSLKYTPVPYSFTTK